MSIKGERIAFDIAKEIAEDLKLFFSKWGKVTIVGSVRRLDKTIGDIDFVIVPKDSKLKAIALVNALKKRKKIEKGPTKEEKEVSSVEINRYGNEMAIFRYIVEDKDVTIPINIWLTTEDSEGAAIMAYTGPKGCSIFYRKLARDTFGYLLNEKGLFDKDGKMIAGKTEEEIYEALGRECKPPERRGKK